ncbi:MAG: hypothetical protein WAZ21_00070 [Candidatus Saccharimonadales bacterium]
MNPECAYEFESKNGKIYEQTTRETGYLLSERSDNRVTVAWPSHLGILKALSAIDNQLGEPMNHMNGSMIRYEGLPHCEYGRRKGQAVPQLLDILRRDPGRVHRIELPYDSMGIVWTKSDHGAGDILRAPVQIQVTAEQHIARAAILRLALDTSLPEMTSELDLLLKGLSYDFMPLSLGETKHSHEWHMMHQGE